jgi:acetyl esterase/lipase
MRLAAVCFRYLIGYLLLLPFLVQGSQERHNLWPGEAPVGEGLTEDTDVFITVFHPGQPNGAAMVICPGGGYRNLVKGPEGTGIAEWLNRHGITGIVLEYRLPDGRPYVPLYDAQRAIRFVRSNASQWRIDPGQIGIIGFSAGGHLAATVATHFDAGNPHAEDPVERYSCRPDFAALVYPVIIVDAASGDSHAGVRKNLLGDNSTKELQDFFSAEKQVGDTTAPAFLAHAIDDSVVPSTNSEVFHQALRAHGVRTRYLELPSGGHGLNRYQGEMWDAWQKQSLEWLAANGLIPSPGLE